MSLYKQIKETRREFIRRKRRDIRRTKKRLMSLDLVVR